MFTLNRTLAAALEEILLKLDVFDLRKCNLPLIWLWQNGITVHVCVQVMNF